MKRLFADTFFFYAFLNADDSAHREAIEFRDQFELVIIISSRRDTALFCGISL